MPKDNVLRAIKKASSKETANYEEISLEGYAANGIAIFVDCATNNNNRTVADVRSYFSKCDGALGTNGSLEFIFNRKGVFTISADNIDMPLEDLEMELIDGGLEELELDEEAITISFPILVNVLAIFDHLFIFLAFLNSNALPI